MLMGDDQVPNSTKEEVMPSPPSSPSHPHVSIRQVSTCTVRLQPPAPDSPVTLPTRCELTSWDIPLLLRNYIQVGQLYSIPNISEDIDGIIHRLKNSLAKALLHYYPLTGRLRIEKATDGVTGLFMYIDCNNEGAEFVHSVADGISVADVIGPLYVPTFVRDFFPHTGAINLDGHNLPLLEIQVTELTDGFFLGCSLNHVVSDGTGFWNFMRSWAEISRGVDEISQPPVHGRWFVEDALVPIRFPYTNHEDMIDRFVPPEELVKRVFHFKSSSIAQLKENVNGTADDDDDDGNGTKKIIISSFQALCALVWRSVTRARCLPESEPTYCLMACSNRHRLLSPPLPLSYFGNCISCADSSASVAELLMPGLEFAATKVHEAVASWTDAMIREEAKRWTSNPIVQNIFMLVRNVVAVGSSPRFEMYCEFGWGKALAVLSGTSNMIDGMVTAFPGKEGGGSVDLEICLMPETMRRLEMDQEFMCNVSLEEIIDVVGVC